MDTIEKALKKQGSQIENQKVEAFQSTDNENLEEEAPTGQEVLPPSSNSTQVENTQVPTNAENHYLNVDAADEPVASVAEQLKQQANEHLKAGRDKLQEVSSRGIELDLDYLSRQGFVSLNETSTQTNIEYRQIKRPLLKNIRGESAHRIEKANLIQVTSSLQSEGKTFNAINLALSMAMELDHTVLLVDADVLKPAVSRSLNIKTEKGLIDFLLGNVESLSEVLLNTNIPKLTLLPAGSQHHLSTELMSSDALDNLFQELSSRYSDRIVIIDSPPLLQTNEAVIISQKVGQVVFVVEQNKTAQEDVKTAVAKLDADRVVGVVINKSRTSGQGGYYGYYGSAE